MSRIGKGALLAAALALGIGAGQAAAENPLSGRTIDFLVTGQPGDGYDTSARLFARYLEAKLGEGTEVVVRLVHDGGGLLRRHVLNTRRRPNRWGISFGKERRDSPRKVDGFAAMQLADMARADVVTQQTKTRPRTGRVW